MQCNGKNQCNRCCSDDAICIYSRKRRADRPYSKEYVQLLEEQQLVLIKGLKELYRRHSTGQKLPELFDVNNDILIHQVLSSLNVWVDSTTADIVSSDIASSESSICNSPQYSMDNSNFDHFATSDSSTPMSWQSGSMTCTPPDIDGTGDIYTSGLYHHVDVQYPFLPALPDTHFIQSSSDNVDQMELYLKTRPSSTDLGQSRSQRRSKEPNWNSGFVRWPSSTSQSQQVGC